jgi:hypothetical protein
VGVKRVVEVKIPGEKDDVLMHDKINVKEDFSTNMTF